MSWRAPLPIITWLIGLAATTPTQDAFVLRPLFRRLVLARLELLAPTQWRPPPGGGGGGESVPALGTHPSIAG
jgi:hypothetical protein